MEVVALRGCRKATWGLAERARNVVQAPGVTNNLESAGHGCYSSEDGVLVTAISGGVRW